MLSLLVIFCAFKSVYTQCTDFCPYGGWMSCDDNDPLDYYKCLSAGRKELEVTCTTYETLCNACVRPCQQQLQLGMTADTLFTDIYKCEPGICTSSPTKSPILPHTPTSSPTPEPTHQCASSFDGCDKSSNCDEYQDEEWFCESAGFDCINSDNVCEACCVAIEIRDQSFPYFAPEMIFTQFCSAGRCPTVSPTNDPTESPSSTPTDNTYTPTEASDAPTTAQPTTPDIGELDIIWFEPLDISTDLSDWSVTDVESVSYMDGSDGNCPSNSASNSDCWSLCAANGAASMIRAASTKGLENIAVRYSVDPSGISSTKGEACTLSYSIDDGSTWFELMSHADEEIIMDELLFLSHDTWDTDSVSIKFEGNHNNGGASCCYLSNLYLYGIPVLTSNPTSDPTNAPSFNPSKDPTITVTAKPTSYPTYTVHDPTSHPVETGTNPTNNPVETNIHPTNNPVETGIHPTNNPVYNPTNNPAQTGTDPTANPVFDLTDHPVIASTDNVVSQPTVGPTLEATHDDDDNDDQKGSNQQSSTFDVNTMIKNPLYIGGACAAVCILIVLICILKCRCAKRQQAEVSIKHIEPQMIPATSPVSEGSFALPMNTNDRVQALAAGSNDEATEAHKAGDGALPETGGTEFPQRQTGLHYVTKGGPDPGPQLEQCGGSNDAESDHESDDDVLRGGVTLGGMQNREPSSSDDLVLMGMSTPQGVMPMDEDDDEIVPPPPLPPSEKQGNDDDDEFVPAPPLPPSQQ